MDKKELKEMFDKNIQYLQRIIPPDDIYIFTEQTLMAAMYFIRVLQNKIELSQECLDDPILGKYVRNICLFSVARHDNEEITIDLKLEDLD